MGSTGSMGSKASMGSKGSMCRMGSMGSMGSMVSMGSIRGWKARRWYFENVGRFDMVSMMSVVGNVIMER
jgi:hypothetical protein